MIKKIGVFTTTSRHFDGEHCLWIWLRWNRFHSTCDFWGIWKFWLLAIKISNSSSELTGWSDQQPILCRWPQNDSLSLSALLLDERLKKYFPGSEPWTNEKCNYKITKDFHASSDYCVSLETSMKSQWYGARSIWKIENLFHVESLRKNLIPFMKSGIQMILAIVLTASIVRPDIWPLKRNQHRVAASDEKGRTAQKGPWSHAHRFANICWHFLTFPDISRHLLTFAWL
jgi:hypothetical protein